MPDPPLSPAFTIPSDWIGEVVSPGMERLDRTRKLPAYARSGVRYAWLVNPLTRTLKLLRLEGGRWLLLSTHADDEIVHAEPFEAAEVDLLLLWGGTRAKNA